MSIRKQRGSWGTATYFPYCLLTSIVFCMGVSGCAEPTPPPPPPPAPVAEEDLVPPRPIITQAMFDKLLYDSQYADVVEELGAKPSRQESTYDEGIEGYTRPSIISWYIWENPDGSFMRLGFTEKRLTDKGSSDLPE